MTIREPRGARERTSFSYFDKSIINRRWIWTGFVSKINEILTCRKVCFKWLKFRVIHVGLHDSYQRSVGSFYRAYLWWIFPCRMYSLCLFTCKGLNSQGYWLKQKQSYKIFDEQFIETTKQLVVRHICSTCFLLLISSILNTIRLRQHCSSWLLVFTPQVFVF